MCSPSVMGDPAEKEPSGWWPSCGVSSQTTRSHTCLPVFLSNARIVNLQDVFGAADRCPPRIPPDRSPLESPFSPAGFVSAERAVPATGGLARRDRGLNVYHVAPDDGRGCSLAGQLAFPPHVPAFAPLYGRCSSRCHCRPIRTTPLSPEFLRRTCERNGQSD